MSKASTGVGIALIVIGIVLLAIGGVVLLGASGTSTSDIGGALTGLAQAIGVGAAVLGGVLVLVGIAFASRRGAKQLVQDAPAAAWPPVNDRTDEREQP